MSCQPYKASPLNLRGEGGMGGELFFAPTARHVLVFALTLVGGGFTWNRYGNNVPSTSNGCRFDIDSTLSRHWLDIDLTLTRHRLDIDSTLTLLRKIVDLTLTRH